MDKVKIVTDSSNCLPPELIRKYDISVVPVAMIMDGRTYRDTIDITIDGFWKIFPTLKEQPTTSAVNPGDFLATFRELGKSTDKIVCILVSRVLSATQESAYQARRLVRPEFPHLNIEIIDSKSSSGGLGFIVLEAARAAQEGKSEAEVIEAATEMVSRAYYLATLDTLKYLIRIGRAPRHASGFGELLQVKPIIGFVDDTGLLDVVARVRGQRKALLKMVNLVEKYAEPDMPLHVMVHYTDGIDTGQELKEMVAERYNCEEIIITRITPVVLCACGPVMGLAFYS